MTIELKSLIKKTLIGAAILILVINAGLLLYYNFYFNNDVLIKYFPTDTVLYINGTPSPEMLKNPSVSNLLAAHEIQQLFTDANSLLTGVTEHAMSFGLIPITYPEGAKLEPLLVVDLGNKAELSNLVNTLHDTYQFHSETINNNFLQRNVVVFAQTQTALDRVNHVVAQRIDSLADNTDVVGNLQEFDYPYVARGVLLARSFSGIRNLKTQQALFGAIISDAGFDTLFFGIRVNETGRIILESEKVGNTNHPEPLLTLLPKDTTTYISATDPLKALTRFFDVLKKSDVSLYDELGNAQDFIEGTYAVSLMNDIAPLLDDQFELVTTNSGALIAFPVDGDQQELKKLVERLLLEYLAVSHPLKQEIELKDGSTGIEIRKNYTNITENTTPVSNTDLYTVKLDTGEEFGMFIRDRIVYIGTSETLLKSVIQYSNTTTLGKLSPCGDIQGGETALLNGEFLSRYNNIWSPIDKLGVVYTEGHDKSLHLCL